MSEIFLIVAIAHCSWKFCVFCHDDEDKLFFFVDKNESVVEQFFFEHIPIREKEEPETGIYFAYSSQPLEFSTPKISHVCGHFICRFSKMGKNRTHYLFTS